MYKVFYNNRVIFLIQDKNHLKDKNNTYEVTTNKDLKKLINKFENNTEIKELTIYNNNLKNLYENFKSHFYYIEAAGGVVQNNKKEILVIYRHKKWDLPKGKIENGEIPLNAGLREVREECGIQNVKIIKELTNSFHSYQLNDKSILKKTFWYLMFNNGDEPLLPQKTEGIEKVMWLPNTKMNVLLDDTYPSVVDVIKDFEIKRLLNI